MFGNCPEIAKPSCYRVILWQNKIFTNQEINYFAIYSEDLISWVFYTLSDNINTDDLQLKKNLLLAAKPNFRRCCTASASHQSKLWPPANLVFLRISVTPNISYFSHSDILAADQSCMSSARPTSVIIKLVIKINWKFVTFFLPIGNPLKLVKHLCGK